MTDLDFLVCQASDVGIIQRNGTFLESRPDRQTVQRTK
jgi:hypothetical protein